MPYAKRIAAAKAAAVAEPGALTLAADTVVAAGRRILPKTEGEAEARVALSLLSGRRHRVLSAVTLIDAEGKARHRLSTSIVAFKPLERSGDRRLSRERRMARQGGRLCDPGPRRSPGPLLSGSCSSVVGLPLYETRALLRAAGYPLG